MNIKAFFDPVTYTLTYVVSDPHSSDALIIDPVRDYDPHSGSTADRSNELVAAYLKEEGLRLRAVLETHAHADHLSGSRYFAERYEVPVGIGARITDVQEVFADLFGLGEGFARDGSQFDLLLQDGQVYEAGSIEVKVIATPGHTPACVSYLIGDALFTGDALFMPDFGTGRCDFPRGSAEDLYDSVHGRLYELPEQTRVFVGHDYQPGGRPLAYETTIGESRSTNKQLKAETTREEYIRFRTERDAQLSAPRLLLPSVQVNIDAGRLPEPEDNGHRYLKIPLDALG